MTDDPGPIHEVDCEPSGERWTLVLTRPVPHPAETVWSALTQPEQLRLWAPYAADRALDATGPAQILDNHDSDTAPTLAQVLACEAPRLLEHTWDVDVVRWELTPAQVGTEGTRLTLRHTLDDRHLVPQLAAGWHICLDAAVAMLDGRPFGPVLGEAAKDYGWDELESRYTQALGVYQSREQP